MSPKHANVTFCLSRAQKLTSRILQGQRNRNGGRRLLQRTHPPQTNLLIQQKLQKKVQKIKEKLTTNLRTLQSAGKETQGQLGSRIKLV